MEPIKPTTAKDLEKKDGTEEKKGDFAGQPHDVGKGTPAHGETKRGTQNARSGGVDPGSQAAAFAAAVAIIAPAVKQLTDAGMGGGEAGKLALEIFRETCCD